MGANSGQHTLEGLSQLIDQGMEWDGLREPHQHHLERRDALSSEIALWLRIILVDRPIMIRSRVTESTESTVSVEGSILYPSSTGSYFGWLEWRSGYSKYNGTFYQDEEHLRQHRQFVEDSKPGYVLTFEVFQDGENRLGINACAEGLAIFARMLQRVAYLAPNVFQHDHWLTADWGGWDLSTEGSSGGRIIHHVKAYAPGLEAQPSELVFALYEDGTDQVDMYGGMEAYLSLAKRLLAMVELGGEIELVGPRLGGSDLGICSSDPDDSIARVVIRIIPKSNAVTQKLAG